MRTILFVSLLLAMGCGPLTGDVDPGNPSKPTVETVWTNIAQDVEAGEYENSDQLQLAVDHLRTRSRITEEQLDAFKEALSDTYKEGGCRKLTKADAEKIRGL